VQPSQKLVPPRWRAARGRRLPLRSRELGVGGGVVAQGMSSGHVIVWRLPSSLAANGGGEGDDVEVLNSILGAEDGSATVGEGDDELVDFAPAPPAPLPRLAETAEPAIKQQQQQQQQQYKPQTASASSLPTGSAADSDGGDSLDGDTPW
jgi:hypothetical protein